ncbi:replication protein [Desulfolucanica intricata]|uniref:replication protein n=1 Tax=Desulfolucanica intricata TaxID=1285191 RepID=UPI000835EBE4|nr:replication protein [Desulfolucanica intricata]
MARGDRENLKADTEDGYTKIANLLLEALTMAKLNGVQKGICLFLWRRTYGWGKKEDKITLKEFARACGTDEPYASRQIKKLINWKIIFRTSYAPGKAASYSMNTRVVEWDKGCIDVQELSECTIQGLYNCTMQEPDNTVQGLYNRTIQPLYKNTIQGLYECTRVVEASGLESQGFAPSLKTNIKKDQRNDSSSLTTTTGLCPVEKAPFSRENDHRPTNKDLIAELTYNYRRIQGICESKGDYAFIGALYNEHGYEQVLTAINKLQTAAAVQELKMPLLYLKGILAKSKPKGGPASGRNPTADRRKNSKTPAEFKISARYAHLIN